ncbi:MAG: peptide deformylase [Atopococcus tabaci]|uniref:Peptide deformylase n=1 Tax=Atopococcus tabaci TaxID=269774 RepID=A0AA43UBL6_9LACT|nr:peptide deformylase [Atopococcus tabaci]
MITMEDIIREGHPALRQRAKKVEIPISQDVKDLGQEMMTFLVNSQDPELSEKYDLRAGVGLAAPQIDQGLRIAAVHIPDEYEDDSPIFSDVLINPIIKRQSVKKAALPTGEGCLSVDREVPGYVARSKRITIEYTDLNNQVQKVKLNDYSAVVVQHEIDHLNGIMFYDHINEEDPFYLDSDTELLEFED